MAEYSRKNHILIQKKNNKTKKKIFHLKHLQSIMKHEINNMGNINIYI